MLNVVLNAFTLTSTPVQYKQLSISIVCFCFSENLTVILCLVLRGIYLLLSFVNFYDIYLLYYSVIIYDIYLRGKGIAFTFFMLTEIPFSIQIIPKAFYGIFTQICFAFVPLLSDLWAQLPFQYTTIHFTQFLFHFIP